MRTLLLSIIAIICMSASCKKTGDSGTTPPNADCDKVMCTMMFAMINIDVKDAAGAPVKLDEVYTLRVATGEKIKHENNGSEAGSYTVLDDGYMKSLMKQKADFRFVGVKDGKEVVNEPFEISADCCHVSKVSGRASIVVK